MIEMMKAAIFVEPGKMTVEFVQSRSRTCGCRSVTRFVRNVRSIVIPVRNEVFRQVLIGKDEVIHLLCLIEILLVFCIAIASGITV